MEPVFTTSLPHLGHLPTTVFPGTCDGRAHVGGLAVVIEDLHDGILQGVHVRLAVCDILLDEPPSCSHVRAANLRREECVERLGLIGRSNLSLSFLKVATVFQVLDDGGAGGRRADAAVLALLAIILALEDFTVSGSLTYFAMDAISAMRVPSV